MPQDCSKLLLIFIDQEIIDAQGLTLLPGAIDPQVHFRNLGLDYKEDWITASCSGVWDKITSSLEMPNPRPLTTNPAPLDNKLHQTADKSLKINAKPRFSAPKWAR